MPDGGTLATLAVTLFHSHSASRKKQRLYTLPQLRAEILATTAAAKADLPWLKLARFGDLRTEKGSLRHDANVLAISGIEADYDGEQMPPEDALERLAIAGIRALVYTSPSHTPAAPRWRVLCPLSTELEPLHREHMLGRLNGLFGGILAAESFTLSQAYYYGSVNRNPAHLAELVDGQPIDLADELDAAWIGRPATKAAAPAADGKPRQGKADTAQLFAEIVSGAAYHEPVTRLAGVWATCGVALLDAKRRLHDAFDAVPAEQRDARWRQRRDDVDRCLLAIYGKQAKEKDGTEHERPAAAPLPPLELLTLADCAGAEWRGYIVKGLIAPGDLVVLFGPPGSAKSALAPYIAHAVALGRTIFGRRVKAGPVLYVAAEDPEGMKMRGTALRAVYGDAGEVLRFVATPIDLHDDGNPDSPGLAAVLEAAERIGAVLIVLDTLARAFPGLDENDARSMGRAVRTLRRLTSRTRALLAVHHGPKGEGATPRGHSILNGDADVTLRIEVDEVSGLRTVHFGKNRNGPSTVRLAFTIRGHELGTDDDGDPVTAVIAEEAESKPAKARTGEGPTLLLRAIESMVAEGHGDTVKPAPDMPAVRAIPRLDLRARLVRDGWFAEPDLLPEQLPNGGVLTDGGYRRENKALTALKLKGLAGFSRKAVWLA